MLRHERGFVLVAVLLISSALMLLVLTSVESHLLESKMSVNFIDKLVAFEAAEEKLGTHSLGQGKYHGAKVILEKQFGYWKEK